MPKATVTVRELKNKDTGVDLSVTSYREIPGLVRSTFEYQIVVVSCLPCFKLPSHKESDVVQFTLFKKFPEFEDLRAKLNEAFSGTAFPPLVKKSLIVSEAVIKERRNTLDTFLKFLSGTARIVTCTHVLTFLGVDAQRAQRFASGEWEGRTQQDHGQKKDQDEDQQQEGMASSSLFEEEEEEEEDFLKGSTSIKVREKEDDNLFSLSPPHDAVAQDTRLFESQDLKRELTEEDEKEFAFIPDAIIRKREIMSVATEDTENDLLNVEEDIDLDTLLSLDTGLKRPSQEPTLSPLSPENPHAPAAKPQPPHKPSLPAKPKPGTKPVTVGAKPAVPSKPAPLSSDAPQRSEPSDAGRPVPAPRSAKPVPTERKTKKGGAGLEKTKVASGQSDMTSDDILQYIAANSEGGEGDLDLFS